MTETNKKYLTYGGWAAGALAVYFLFFNNSESGGGDGVDPTGNGPENPGSTTSAGNIFNARKIAVELYDIMKSTGYASIISGNGDEADMIIDILTPIGQAQFGEVIAAFGNLNYNEVFGNQRFLTTPTKHNLPFWLKTELGVASEEYKTLKAKFPKYL